jgi:hypothetical protein
MSGFGAFSVYVLSLAQYPHQMTRTQTTMHKAPNYKIVQLGNFFFDIACMNLALWYVFPTQGP